jgi:hypothetical protein
LEVAKSMEFSPIPPQLRLCFRIPETWIGPNKSGVSLRPSAATAADDSPVAMMSSLFGGQKSEQQRMDAAHPTPPGPRISGIYSAAGVLRLEFHPVTVIVDCGDAHALASYSVQNSADQISVTVNNGNSPLTLTLRPDGSLSGSGMTQVTGASSTDLRGSHCMD